MSHRLTRTEIEQLIPHRAPILLLDEITAWESDTSIEATRHFTPQDPLFNGHFPGNPLLPGVLMVEAMAQAAATLISLTHNLTAQNALYIFAGIESARFAAMVKPGDTLILRAEKLRDRLNIYRFAATAHVGDELAAEATFTAKLVRT